MTFQSFGAAIEARLRAMQRKLSEIAEIPKILSSTLATVSQTFDKLSLNGMSATSNYAGNELYHQQKQEQLELKRKLSYDEDAYDYELSDDGDDEDNDDDEDDADEEFNAKEAYQRLRQHVAKQKRSKDITPESDYASENNYSLDGADDDNSTEFEHHNDVGYDANDDEEDNVDDDDDDDDDDNLSNIDTCKEFNLEFFLTPSGHNNKSNKTESEDDEDDEEEEDDDEEDFLSTTFTWNLRNKPKLQINGNNFTDSVVTDISENPENNHSRATSADADASNTDKDTNVLVEKQNALNNTTNTQQTNEDETLTKQPKLDKFWPWADREKIIYKQSTCHLVPKKPFGLIEQRIQLLSKRNLLEHLGPNNKANNNNDNNTNK